LPDFFPLSTSLAASRHSLPALCRPLETSRAEPRYRIHMKKNIDKNKQEHRIGNAASTLGTAPCAGLQAQFRRSLAR